MKVWASFKTFSSPFLPQLLVSISWASVKGRNWFWERQHVILPNLFFACVCAESVQLCPALCPQAPLSMGFSRQEHWSGLSFPSPGDLPGPKDQNFMVKEKKKKGKETHPTINSDLPPGSKVMDGFYFILGTCVHFLHFNNKLAWMCA